MRMIALLVALVLVALPARAADPVGVWELDQQAWQAFVDRVVPKVMARIPAEHRAAMAASGLDLETQIRAGFMAGLEVTLELKPGGEVISRDGKGVEDGGGLWRDDGKEIEIELPGEGLVLHGPLKGGRIALRPRLDTEAMAAVADDPLWQEALGGQAFVLVRRP